MQSLLLLFLLALFSSPAAAVTAPQSPMTVRFENRSAHDYAGWLHATLPIPPGVAADEQSLTSVVLTDATTGAVLPTVLTPLKWHWTNGVRTSIALASAEVNMQLPANSELLCPVAPGAGTTSGFVWNADLQQWTQGGTLPDDVYVLARFVGDPDLYVARLPGDVRVLEENGARLVARCRSSFHGFDDPSVQHPMSLTSYWTLQSGEAHGTVTFVVGNDTLEQPVDGGIHIDTLFLVHRTPCIVRPRAMPASGVHGPYYWRGFAGWELLENQLLADGQTFAVDFTFCIATDVNAPQLASMSAAAATTLLGIADLPSWRASHAAGPTGYVPAPRFTDVGLARAALAGSSVLPQSRPTDDFAFVNRNPPGTGDQPDFMANIPLFYVQAVQTASTLPLDLALVAAKRECWRPSFYWDSTSGHPERVSLVTYPDLFFWSGRPHYDPSWNLQYPQWNTRAAGFSAGDTGGWSGMDNQHFGHNAVRAAYELTADPYLADVLRANISILYWDFFTDWMSSTEAERTGRLMKEAVMLYSLFPDQPEAAPLRRAIEAKLRVFALTALDFRNLYNFAAVASVRNDPRVGLSQQFPNDDVHMSWQAGFNMEAMTLAYRTLGNAYARAVLQHYLDHAHQLFLADGSPKTYTLMNDPTQFTTGGIGREWWSGWVLAHQAIGTHANSALFDQFVMPVIRSALIPGPNVLWWTNDRWRCFE